MRDRLFLPETISKALDTDLANGLRAIADALDSGQRDGKHLHTMPAVGGFGDERIHLLVSLDHLTAPILQPEPEEVAEHNRLLDESVLTAPPHGMKSRDSLRLHGSVRRGREPENGV